MAYVAPSFFVSHGTALHTLDPDTAPFQALRAEGAHALRTAGQQLRGVVVVSAHWPSARASGAAAAAVDVGGASAPATVHDHPSAYLYGFRYPARGDAAVSTRVADTLRSAGFDVRRDDERGLDHGAWIALEMLFPGAPVPVVPVSLPSLQQRAGTTAPEAQLQRFGEALARLRGDGIALVFSGGATHNQDVFRAQFLARKLDMGGSEAALLARRQAVADAEATVAADVPWSIAFDAWLTRTLAQPAAPERTAELARYASVPGGTLAHPEPSHFLPVLAFAASCIAGADGGGGDGRAERVAHGFQYGLSMSAYKSSTM